MRSRVVECCAALGRAFDRVGARWFLFGAQAAILRGARRFTADVDVTVDPGDRSTIEGVHVPTARTEDLVVMKILAGRPLDTEDVVAMLAANDVDQLAISTDLRELEALLDQRDLIPAYEAALRRAEAARARRK